MPNWITRYWLPILGGGAAAFLIGNELQWRRADVKRAGQIAQEAIIDFLRDWVWKPVQGNLFIYISLSLFPFFDIDYSTHHICPNISPLYLIY